MTIKLILIALFAIVGLVALSQMRTARILSSALMILCALAMLSVLFDEFAIRVANAVGVGRGADLIFYLFIPAALLTQLLLYLNCKSLERSITELSRHVALANARTPSDN